MGNLFFPQLSTGALVQYPVKRIKSVHTAGYLAEDGTKIMYFDPNGSALTWQLTYSGLTQDEVSAVENLFEACCGQCRSFTFLDPLGNLLGPEWHSDPGVHVSGAAFTNASQSPARVSQTLLIPAAYTYSFSLPGNPAADAGATITLFRSGPTVNNQIVLPLQQRLLVSSGALADPGTSLTVGVVLQPGQSIDLSQAQLEGQPAPSAFRPAQGGIYSNAYWAIDDLTFVADGPNSFSTKLSITTHL
jgi:hypothetical protein